MDEKSKKISKNAVMLTIRMILLMGISLYTSRVVLAKLGIEDFGIYNVLGSLAVTFSFFSSALINATQRFLTIEIGKKDYLGAIKVFKLHLTCYFLIAISVLFVSEVLGCWIIACNLTISADRLSAAFWVFEFAVFSVLINLVTVPFESLIVAYEDMSVYAYVGIVEAVFKLLSVCLLTFIPLDKLIIFAFFMFILNGISRLFFVLYSHIKYRECKIGFLWDKNRVKTALRFVLWNLISTADASISNQGISLLLNVFVGPIANAARGINAQVSGAVFKLSNSILIAIQPQMVKSYAMNDGNYMKKLFLNATRYSFLALWLLVSPIIFFTDEILSIWLIDIPRWSASFIKISLVSSLFYVLSKPIWSVVVASGKLKRYVLCNFCMTLLMIFLTFLSLKKYGNPIYVYIISAGCSFFKTVLQLFVVRYYVNYSFFEYIKNVVRPITTIVFLIVAIYFAIEIFQLQNFEFILSCSIICFANVLLIIWLGLQKNEKELFWKKVKGCI